MPESSRSENIIDLYDDVSNPLDGIEEIMLNNDWAFDRRDNDQMSVTVTGKSGVYQMAFVWQEEFSAMQFCCAPDITIHPSKMDEAAKVLNQINSTLWLGHFDVRSESLSGNDNIDHKTAYVPCFRHTSLFRGMNETSGVDHIEDLIDIALAECERYAMTFELLSKVNNQDIPISTAHINLAMMDVAGQS
ncbi:MAG TPA: YbjN domain-containing protein [Alphaproteobacteria bacterium]|nr:YbjN domain-containing protein [Alphaproteobacteria bacterium]